MDARWLIVALIFLRGQQECQTTAFAAGVIAVRTLQFVLFGRLFGKLHPPMARVFDLIPRHWLCRRAPFGNHAVKPGGRKRFRCAATYVDDCLSGM